MRVGQEIRRGELVGAVGSTGKVTAPHLHYEVRIGGVPRESASVPGAGRFVRADR